MKKRRLLSGLLALSLILTACGGTKTVSSSQSVNQEYVYQEGNINYAQDNGDITRFITVGDTIYTEQYIYPEYGSVMPKTEIMVDSENPIFVEEEIQEDIVTRVVTSYTFDGTKINELQTKLPENTGNGFFTADTQGNIYSAYYEYATYVEDDTTDRIYLTAHSPKGEELWRIHLNKEISERDNYYLMSLYCIDDKQLILESYSGIEIYDLQGNRMKLVEKTDKEECRLFKIRDNQFAYIITNDEKHEIQKVDIEKETFGEKIKLPFNYYRYGIFDGGIYDIYLSDEYGVYGYNIGDEQITKIMDFISSDFSGSHMYQIVGIDESSFLAYYYADGGNVLHKFTKVAPEDVVEKINLTIGCYYLDGSIKKKLIEFNKNSKTHKIHVMDYSVYDSVEDYTQGMTKLNTDIVSGNVPDILLLNTDMPLNSYMAKGLFTDFYTFMEKDPDFKKEDFISNIWEVFSNDGALYQLIPSFAIMTFTAKTADVGKERGWTMDEALALLESKTEGTQLISEVTRNSFINYCMWLCNEQYVNWETGECNFESDGFLKILEYAKTLPDQIDNSDLYQDDSFWNEMETQYRDGRTLISMTYLSDFKDYSYARYGTFGEDITFIGFPVETGEGSSITATTRFAISSQSKNQQAAWDFVKTFFTEEYQDSLEYEFPVRISSLEKREQKTWEIPYYINEDGEKVENKDTYYIGGVEIEVDPLTKEETGLVKDLINNIDKATNYEDDLYNIIMEEAEFFFAGQKSVQETASIIQSRAKIYVNENR